MTSEQPATYQIRALDRGLDIMEALLADGDELGIAELAQVTSIPKPTLVRLLSVLTNRGYVDRNPETDRYRLGVRTLELGTRYMQRTSVEIEAKPIMLELVNQANQTANLGVLQDFEVVHVEVVAPNRPVRFWASVGSREAAHVSGLGKVLLTSLNENELQAYLQQDREAQTPNTITRADDLKKELRLVQSRGYAFDDEESNPGIRCIAAPIFNGLGDIVAAISISGLKEEFEQGNIQTLADYVVSAAGKISLRLGARSRRETDQVGMHPYPN